MFNKILNFFLSYSLVLLLSVIEIEAYSQNTKSIKTELLESRNNCSRIPLWYANNNDHSSIQVLGTRKGMFYIHDLRWCQSDLGCMCSTTTGPRRLPPCPEHMMSSSSVSKEADMQKQNNLLPQENIFYLAFLTFSKMRILWLLH